MTGTLNPIHGIGNVLKTIQITGWPNKFLVEKP